MYIVQTIRYLSDRTSLQYNINKLNSMYHIILELFHAKMCISGFCPAKEAYTVLKI